MSRSRELADAQAETLSIPKRVREEVRERDGGLCRFCGAWGGENLAIHHIEYRSEGGLHVAENLVSVHFMYAPRCHEAAHGDKGLWQPILQQVAQQPGTTALALARWQGLTPARVNRL